MGFTYDFSTALQISQVRLLIPDTTPPGIFSDAEVSQALQMESSQSLYVSGQAAPSAASITVIPIVYSVRRSAALLLDVLASKLSQQAAVESIQDVKQNCAGAARECAARATSLRQQEEDMGQFAIAEMVTTAFSARERVYSQLLRIEGS